MARSDYKTKLVNGERVDLTEAEIDECVARDEVAAAEATAYAAVKYKDDRIKGTFKEDRTVDKAGYTDLGDFADAVYWEKKGDDSKMTAWVAACAQVKSDHPKPD